MPNPPIQRAIGVAFTPEELTYLGENTQFSEAVATYDGSVAQLEALCRLGGELIAKRDWAMYELPKHGRVPPV